jgi:8-oxo-dGTP diphosphatase
LGSYGRLTTGALVIVPGPGGTVTFVRQERGPYAGWWLLPGGKVEFGESLEDSARREALEEAGCAVGALSPVGLYEMRGGREREGYHFLMFVFRAAGPVVPPAGFSGHDVGEVRQMRPADMRPHPTDMRILNDAGVAAYPDREVEAALSAGGVLMTGHLAAAAAAGPAAVLTR